MQRVALALVAVAALGAAVVMLAGFVWPSDAPPDFLNLGRAEEYARGSVTMNYDLAEFTDLRWDVRPVLYEARPKYSRANPVAIALVRHEDGSFSALLARDPRSGCPMPWRPDFSFEGRLGWFRDPCHGSTYNRDGERVFGPTPRDMDYFEVHVNEDGEVIVDLRELHEGDPYVSPTYRGAREDATPQPTGIATEQDP